MRKTFEIGDVVERTFRGNVRTTYTGLILDVTNTKTNKLYTVFVFGANQKVTWIHDLMYRDTTVTYKLCSEDSEKEDKETV